MSKFLTLSKIYINKFFNWFLKQFSQDEIRKIKEKPVNAIFNKALLLVFFSFISLVFIFISCGENSKYLSIEELKNNDGTYNIELVEQQSKNGNPLAQSTLGFIYLFGAGVNQDYFEAVKWFKKAAEQGDVLAQLNLGNCYKFGHGVNQDYFEAVKWYKKAADQGNPNAQLILGNCYQSGHGVKQNYFEAFKWFEKSAERGNALAQLSLFYCYQKGRGVKKDFAEAVKWAEKAAVQGEEKAQMILGEIYRDGRGVNQDFFESAKWFKKAAEQGNSDAQTYLGGFYIYGLGVNQDYTEAIKWLKKAAKQGNKEALYGLETLHKQGFNINQGNENEIATNNNFNLFEIAEFESKKDFEKNISATFKTYFSGSEKSYKLEFSNGKEIWINYLNTERDGRAYFKASNGIKEIFGSISFTKGDLEINFEDSDYEKLNGSYSRTR